MRIGIADTTFSRVDMAAAAIGAIKKEDSDVLIERYTVPGFKDLPVACKRLIEAYGCEIIMAFGWVGKEDIDEACAHEANQGIMFVEVLTGIHVLKVFVHEKESSDGTKLAKIAKDRAEKHALNAIALIKGKDELTKFAGKGKRQGHEDAGEIG